jgi:hypothetical protein
VVPALPPRASGIARAYPRYRGRVVFLAADEQEPAGAVAPFAARMKLTFPVGLDGGQMAATYGAGSIPESASSTGGAPCARSFAGP